MSIKLLGCLMGLTLSLPACGGTAKAPAPVTSGAEESVEARVAPVAQEASLAELSADKGSGQILSSRPILDLLPGDRSMVFHVAWRTILASDFFREHRASLMKSFDSEIDAIRVACGYDPVEEIESLTFAVGADPQLDNDIIIAANVLVGRSQIEDCFVKTGGKVESGKYSTQGDPIHVLWISDSTVLFSAKVSAAKMKAALAKGRARDQEALMEFIGKTDKHAAIWAGGLVPPSLGGMLGGGVTLPHGFYVSVNAWSGIDASMGLTFPSEKDARATQALLQMGLNMLSSQLQGNANAIQLQQSGNNIFVDVALSPDDLEKLINDAK